MAVPFPPFPGARLWWKAGGRTGALLAAILALSSAAPLRAVTIERVFVPVGEAVPGVGFTSLAPPATTLGSGDFQTVINTACDLWEFALQEDYTLTLYFAWSATSSGRAEHYGLAFAQNPTREIAGAILFDATPGGGYFFYLDPTPDTSEEFRLFAEGREDYGGGRIVHERRFYAATGDAAHPEFHDLLSIAVHEIGHALGLSYAHPGFAVTSPAGAVLVDFPRPHAGTILPLAENAFGGFTSHLDGPASAHFVMGLGEGTPGTRYLPTAGDILALAQLNDLTRIELDPHPVITAYAPGLVADYFASEIPFAGFPALENAVPDATGMVDVIRFRPGTIPWGGLDARFARNWAARFVGTIRIATSGVHTFHLTHDGGARLTLGDVAVVQPHGAVGPVLARATFAQDQITYRDMWHPDESREDTIRVWLDAGYHFFALEFADNEAPGRCELAWAGPGFAQHLVPASAFWHPVWAEITGRPAIAGQPQPLRLAPGENGRLHIDALGLPEMDFQWRRDGVALTGATTSTLELTGVSGADSGIYDCLIATDAGVTVSAAVPVAVIGATPGRPINVSVRGPSGKGEQTLIAGFTIAGDAMAKKTVLIRVAGPALAEFDVTDHVVDPSLTIFDQRGDVIASNDDWDLALRDDFLRVSAFPWVAGSRDAAVKLALPPGEYTAHAVNPGGTSAIALIEIYDLSQDSGTSLVNCSCRTVVTPDRAVIAGFILDAPASLLVRHAGPALAQFDVANVARDPALEIFRGDRSLSANNDWEPALESIFRAARAFPWARDSADAATLFAAPAGAYTIHCRVNGSGGVSLIELYTAP